MTLRVLVVGAGAIGGCFVGRLLEFGADVTWGRMGLAIQSRLGNADCFRATQRRSPRWAAMPC